MSVNKTQAGTAPGASASSGDQSPATKNPNAIAASKAPKSSAAQAHPRNQDELDRQISAQMPSGQIQQKFKQNFPDLHNQQERDAQSLALHKKSEARANQQKELHKALDFSRKNDEGEFVPLDETMDGAVAKKNPGVYGQIEGKTIAYDSEALRPEEKTGLFDIPEEDLKAAKSGEAQSALVAHSDTIKSQTGKTVEGQANPSKGNA